MMIRTYQDLLTFQTFEERFKYLKLHGKVGEDTFGFDRVFNQMFYRSKEWKRIRNEIIVRDLGCDLGIEGREILNSPVIHHMNPISIDDIRNSTEFLLNPNYLITVTSNTHRAIHYGDESMLALDPIDRHPNDTCPWKH